MREWCVRVLGLSEHAAYKRIRAARAARRFPVLFEAVADGRLHLTAVVLLWPHLRPENVTEMIALASRKSKAEIEATLAARFPSPESLPLVVVVGSANGSASSQLVPEPVGITGERAPEPVGEGGAELVLEPVGAGELVLKPVEERASTAPIEPQAPGRPGSLEDPGARGPAVPDRSVTGPGSPARAGTERSRIKPIATERYLVQLSIGKPTHEKLRRAQQLLSHAVPSGDLAEVLDRALDALVTKLEKRKLAKTDKPHREPKATRGPRSVPAHVRRAVHERDGDRCTFVSEDGRPCECRQLLELDHIVPVAHGGATSVENLRLRCRTHNQLEAERIFGAEFMRRARERNKAVPRSA